MQNNALEYLENTVKTHPGKFAFSDQHEQVNYAALLQQARAIGCYLARHLKGAVRKPVVVLVERDIHAIIMFLGVLFSGNFYVPIENQSPLNRKKLILDCLQPEVILTAREDLNEISQLDFNGQILQFKEALKAPIDKELLAGIRERVIDSDPIFAVFTSGSSGIPKGVLISHRSVIDLIERHTCLFGFNDQNVLGNQAPLDYDGAIRDIFTTIKHGASLHIIPKMLFAFPLKLLEHLRQKNINTIVWATSALRLIANLQALEKGPLPILEKIFFTGEVMPNKVLNYFRKHFPQALFVNLYGPTEITCNCTYFIVKRPFTDDEVLPIGLPFPNIEILLLDEHDRPAGQGEIGEICVRGTCLALGYYNNPAETARAFCNNPLNPAYPEKIYRTGDLGKYNEKGELLFLSRKDQQIKHMGYRIELGEIEAAANALGCLEVACALYDAPREKIVLFYQASDKCDQEILRRLRESLPKFMLPNRLVHSEHLPLNKNGKIDRVILKESLG